MAREQMVPVSVVKLLLEQQNRFTESMVTLLGEYLEKASKNYQDALNPPAYDGPDVPMQYSRLSEEEEDLQYQLEAGLITSDQYKPAMSRVLKDTDISIETH